MRIKTYPYKDLGRCLVAALAYAKDQNLRRNIRKEGAVAVYIVKTADGYDYGAKEWMDTPSMWEYHIATITAEMAS